MLRYYPPDWQTVLKDAKSLYRCWLVTDNAYPSPGDGYKEAEECIREASANFKRENGVCPVSNIFLHIHCFAHFRSDSEVTHDMKKMVSPQFFLSFYILISR
jgi:hypothetical protein